MERGLRDKIIELFEYRELPHLIMLGNKGQADDELYEKLINLQASIYYLDEVLETNWDVNPKDLDVEWLHIHDNLRTLGVSDNQLDTYSRHIYKYQRHELELRQAKYPMRLSMEYFYFYKSCDVKLLRKLIYDKYPSLNKVVKLSEWRVFDLVTEINDDVEDLYEDMHTINGNRFLLSLLILGKERTTEIYKGYLSQLNDRQQDIAQPLNRKMSITVYNNTKSLLEERLENYSKHDIGNALIAQYVCEKVNG